MKKDGFEYDENGVLWCYEDGKKIGRIYDTVFEEAKKTKDVQNIKQKEMHDEQSENWNWNNRR